MRWEFGEWERGWRDIWPDMKIIFSVPDDKDHGVPNVPIGSITRSKAKKIQQTFILHLQNWIGFRFKGIEIKSWQLTSLVVESLCVGRL